MFLTSANTYIHNKYTQDLWCSFLVCQSHLALVINDQTFYVLAHLMTMSRIIAYMPVEYGVELDKNILFETRSRSPSAFGTWVKFNLLVWIYGGSFLIWVDWHQVFVLWWVYGSSALGKTLLYQTMTNTICMRKNGERIQETRRFSFLLEYCHSAGSPVTIYINKCVLNLVNGNL